MNKIGFFTPVLRGGAPEAFDKYFYLGGRECRVLQDKGNKRFDVVSVNQHGPLLARIFLTALKVISYLTIITPLVMLIGKAIARSKSEFVLKDEVQHVALNLQSRFRAVRIQRDFQNQRSAALKIQSHWRAYRAKKELNQLKQAAVVVQSRRRGIEDRGEFLAQKQAAIKIQSHWKAYQAKKKLSQLKQAAVAVQSRRKGKTERREYLKKQAAAVKIQSHIRERQDRKAYLKLQSSSILIQRTVRAYLKEKESKRAEAIAAQKRLEAAEAQRKLEEIRLRKKEEEQVLKAKEQSLIEMEKSLEAQFGPQKIRALKSIHEFVKSEKCHLNTLKEQRELILSDEYKKFIRDPSLEGEYNAFCNRFSTHIEHCENQITRLEAIAGYLVITEEDCSKFVCFEKGSVVLAQRNFASLKQDVKGLCQVVCGEEFVGYLHEKLDIGCERKRFFELIDVDKISEESKLKKVDPCFLLGAQRLMRYPDMLANTKSIVKKIGLNEEVTSLQKAFDTTKEVSWLSEETMREIEQLMTYFADSNQLEKTPAGYTEFIFGTKAASQKAFDEAVEKYVSEKKVLDGSPKNGLRSSSAESKKQMLWGELVPVAIKKDVNSLPLLLNKEKLDEDDLTKLIALEKKFLIASAWINDTVKQKTLNNLITEIRIKKHWSRLTVLTEIPKVKLTEEQRTELNAILAEIGEKQQPKNHSVKVQSLVDSFVSTAVWIA